MQCQSPVTVANLVIDSLLHFTKIYTLKTESVFKIVTWVTADCLPVPYNVQWNIMLLHMYYICLVHINHASIYHANIYHAELYML